MELLSDDRCPAAAQATTVLSCVACLRFGSCSFPFCNQVRHRTRHVYVWSSYYSVHHAFALCCCCCPSITSPVPQSCELVQRHSHQPIGEGRR
jgi:hypothetical protein